MNPYMEMTSMKQNKRADVNISERDAEILLEVCLDDIFDMSTSRFNTSNYHKGHYKQVIENAYQTIDNLLNAGLVTKEDAKVSAICYSRMWNYNGFLEQCDDYKEVIKIFLQHKTRIKEINDDDLQ